MNKDLKPITKTVDELTENDYERKEWKKKAKAIDNVLNKTEKPVRRRRNDDTFTFLHH